MSRIEKIVFIEDSADEVFLTRLLFKRDRIEPELVHYSRFELFEKDLVAGVFTNLETILVVIDLNLKVSKGTDGLKRLRELAASSGLIAGICTGSDDPADVLEARAANSDFFVCKPLDGQCLTRIGASVPALTVSHSTAGNTVLELLRAAA